MTKHITTAQPTTLYIIHSEGKLPIQRAQYLSVG